MRVFLLTTDIGVRVKISEERSEDMWKSEMGVKRIGYKR